MWHQVGSSVISLVPGGDSMVSLVAGGSMRTCTESQAQTML